MPSAIEDAIEEHLDRIEAREAPVRRTLYKAYLQSVESLNSNLAAVTKMIERRQQSGEPVNPDWLRRQSRYQRLINLAQAEMDRFADESYDLVQKGKQVSANAGASDAWVSMESTGVSSSFEANLNKGAIERVAAAFQEDTPLRKTLQKYGDERVQAIESGLLEGVIKGENARVIARNINKTLKQPLSKARLETITRTETMRAYRNAAADQYEKMQHRISGYRWIAGKSTRTCLACLALDGKTFPVYPREFPHPNCRCVVVALPLDHLMDLLPPYETGEEWLAKQPHTVQQKMFPSFAAWQAYNQGKVTPANFVGYAFSPIWGTSIRVKSWKSVSGGYDFAASGSKESGGEAITTDASARATSSILDELTNPQGPDVVQVGPIQNTALDWWESKATENLVITRNSRTHYLGEHPELEGVEDRLVQILLKPEIVHVSKNDANTAIFFGAVDDTHDIAIVVSVSQDQALSNSVISARIQRSRRKDSPSQIKYRVWEEAEAEE